MVKEKGNYKYRSLCMVAEVGAAGLGYLMGDDQWKARQTCSWCENHCIVKPSFPWTETSLSTFNLATASETHPVSGAFAQLSCWFVCLFELLLHLEFLVVFETCLSAFILAFSPSPAPHSSPPKSMSSLTCVRKGPCY